MKVILEIFNLL